MTAYCVTQLGGGRPLCRTTTRVISATRVRTVSPPAAVPDRCAVDGRQRRSAEIPVSARPPAIVGRYRDDVTDDEITAGAGDGDANCRKGPAHRLGCGRLPPSTPAHLEADRTRRLSPNAGRDTPAMRGFPTLRSTVCPLFRRRLGGLLHPASYINLYCYYYNHLTASFPGQPG